MLCSSCGFGKLQESSRGKSQFKINIAKLGKPYNCVGISKDRATSLSPVRESDQTLHFLKSGDETIEKVPVGNGTRSSTPLFVKFERPTPLSFQLSSLSLDREEKEEEQQKCQELPYQRHSHRVPLRLKSTASSEANSLHRTAGLERSAKPEDRRSAHTVLQEKKKVLRMADLETKLDQTMDELKKLKEQLASAESAKTVVQKKLDKVKKTVVFPQSTTTVPNPDDVDEKDEKKKPLPIKKDSDSCITLDVDQIGASCSEENASQLQTKVMIEETSRSEEKEGEEVESKLLAECAEILEMAMVRAKLAEKEKELKIVVAEKESLKKEAEEAKACSFKAGQKTEEMEIKLAGTEEELKQSKSLVEQLKLKLEAEAVAKASMEAEMKRLKIQTDQWRKASEAAASIIATGDENFRSTQKPLESYNFSTNGVLWSPLITGSQIDEGQEGQKKRGSVSGIRVLGELWKKKGQQK
ncbi:hypothetical protein IEQ34_006896 [Dendrobium chrysotoxum]|uniref:Uncharacterized protein n=1 Tax=Dendrobium chrysotoxum TaxID=161865 RepID=A0AAV7H7T9_DENCH|nr:hypothetical protein IEQ34_006896 [Dendrobium chrysotoxum]